MVVGGRVTASQTIPSIVAVREHVELERAVSLRDCNTKNRSFKFAVGDVARSRIGMAIEAAKLFLLYRGQVL
eukprot:3414131-Amphidinium_carterae.2